MKTLRILFLITVVILLSAPGTWADSVQSFTGTLTSPEDTFTTTFSLASKSAVTLQSWGFGGGKNAAGKSIAAGGFDPLLALFSGTGSLATILTDGSGNPLATSDVLSNYSSFMGCPPAGTVNIGGSAVCGDITMSFVLNPGIYTVLLSDADYIPLAVNPGPPGASHLGDGFTDLTGGAFQTCNTDPTGATTCATDTGNWAFDLTTKSTVVTPEPATTSLLLAGLVGLGFRRLRRKSA